MDILMVIRSGIFLVAGLLVIFFSKESLQIPGFFSKKISH